jgi:hypothetical protein
VNFEKLATLTWSTSKPAACPLEYSGSFLSNYGIPADTVTFNINDMKIKYDAAMSLGATYIYILEARITYY